VKVVRARSFVVSQIVVALLQLAQVVLLARLLNAADFGAMAFAASTLLLCGYWTDFGMSGVIAHRPQMDAAQRTSLLAMNVVLAALLGIALYAAAPVLAALLSEPQLADVLRVLCPVLAVSAAGAHYRALHQRDFRFAAIALAEVAGAAMSLLVAYAVALRGGGVYALAAGMAAGATSSTALRSGALQVGSGSINFIYSQLDVLLVGSGLGTDALGKYSLAKQLCLRPIEIISPMITRSALPAMAAVRGNTEALRGIYLDGLRVVNALNFPIFAVLVVAAEPLILLLFGARWSSMTPVLQWLAAAMLIRSFGGPVGPLLVATGEFARAFRWDAAMLILLPPVILVSSRFGIEGTAAGLFLMYACVVYPMWDFLVRPACAPTFSAWIGTALRPLAIAGAAGGVALLAGFQIEAAATRLLAQLAAVAIAYSVLSILLNPRALKAARAYW
jgi:lipopolysaccharide exporter